MTKEQSSQRPPLPPFDATTAAIKARKAEDAWNNKNPEAISKAYSIDSQWRNRHEIFSGRQAIIEFLQRKWQTEHDYRLIKEVWAWQADRIAVRFAYEWHNGQQLNNQQQWFRSYGNENWQFDENGLMCQRHASINDLAITESQRLFRWKSGPRPDDHPGLTDLGL